jgi:membrane protein involved in colicin uptake
MAISQGLQSIGESVDSFKQLGAVIRTQVVTAFSTLRGAIIATGIGALAVAIGLLIANWNEFTEYIKKSFPALFELGETIGGIVEKITDYVGITSQAKRESEEWAKAIVKITKALDNQIAELEAQGGREDEVYKLKRQRLEYQLQAIQGNSEKEIEERADLNSKLRILDIQEQKRKQSLIEQEKAEIEKYNEWLLNQEIISYEKRKAQRKKQETIGSDGLTDSERKQKVEDDAKAKSDSNKKMQEFNEESEKNGLGRILAIKAKADLDSIKQDEDTAAAKKRIDELEKESKQATAYAISDIVAGLSNVIGQETAAGKAIAIASATIDTYLSASTIFKQASKNPITVINPAYPYLMAAPAVLGGIARVKQIASVSVPRGGGGSGSMPSMSSAAPMPPQLPMASTTNLSQQTINDIGNQAVRAYVVESDVTSSQERITAIRQRARFS